MVRLRRSISIMNTMNSKLPKPSKDDKRRHREIERRVEREGVQLDHPKGKELFDKVLKRAKK
jgi:hypothetical protein